MSDELSDLPVSQALSDAPKTARLEQKEEIPSPIAVTGIPSREEMLGVLARFGYWFNLNDCDDRPNSDALEIPIGDLRAARDLIRRAVSTQKDPGADND